VHQSERAVRLSKKLTYWGVFIVIVGCVLGYEFPNHPGLPISIVLIAVAVFLTAAIVRSNERRDDDRK
jgi:ABC-type Mn2+/Zn2+ transport system permease subunit